MKRKLICIMAIALTTWIIQAAFNPSVVEVTLTGGGLLGLDGAAKKVDLTCSGGGVRLAWTGPGGVPTDKIAVYEDAECTSLISGNEKTWNPAPATASVWVKGVKVSEAIDDVHMTLEALQATGTTSGPIKFTVYQVDSITVTPKNAPVGWTPPVPVTIGAGAIHSPAHQADVTIQVQPTVAGIPIDVSLSGCLSYEPGKAAKLVMGTQAATGGGAVVTVLTGTNGTISGELTSSDVNNMECWIHASATETNVVFTWDEYFEQDAWTFEPGYLPVPGVLTNHLVLRHHRDGADSATTNGLPWQPLNGHDIRFFVEKVEYWDADGNLCETNNTAEAPADVSAWATFPTNPVTTDANGRVTELLTIVTNANLQSVSLVAYDWSVWVSPAPAAPVAPLSGFGFRALAAPPAPPESSLLSNTRIKHTPTRSTAAPVGFGTLIAFQPQEVPLHQEGSSTAGFGGLLFIYIADLNASSANWTFDIRTNMVAAGTAGWSALLPSAVARIDQIRTAVNGGINFISEGLTPDRFNEYRIVVREPARYQVKIRYQSLVRGTFEFDTIAGGLDFAGLNATAPIILTTNRHDYVLFPLTNTSASLVVTGKVVATVPDGTPYSIDSITSLNAGSDFHITNIVGQPFNFQLWGKQEGDHDLIGKFKIKAKGIRKQITSIGNGLQGTDMTVITDPAATEVRSGSFTNLHLVCPNMYIARPTGTLPPDGENGAVGYFPSTSPLFVFDTPTAPSNCLMACETPHLSGLSSEFVRSLVWKNVEWINPSVFTVWSVTTNTFPAEPWKTEFRYNQMPLFNQAFGNTNLVLRFKNRHAWRWDQQVQFRFARTGTNAAASVNSVLGFWSTNYVAAGNPNWYVYWQQVANGFINTNSGSFGPQTTSMVYYPSDVGPGGEAANYVPTQRVPWLDTISIFNTCGEEIVKCVTGIHHENGHHQSRALPQNQGGFGTNLVWTFASDRDYDFINDLWETNGIGYTLGFSIDATQAGVDRESKWRGNWDHGWTNATGYGSCTNPPPYPQNPYCNTNGINATTGSGLCPRNEDHVTNQSTAIKSNDWSFTGL